jgi:hypothetical protein
MVRANFEMKNSVLEDGVTADLAWSTQVKPMDVVIDIALWGNTMLTNGYELRQADDGSVDGWLLLREDRAAKAFAGVAKLKDAEVTLTGGSPHLVKATVRPCVDDDLRAPCWVDVDE